MLLGKDWKLIMMKNERIEFDGIEVIEPSLVYKLGLVYDFYKDKQLPQLWEECEEKVAEQMPTFKADEFFHQEQLKDGALHYSFRYYTPKSNIKTKAS